MLTESQKWKIRALVALVFVIAIIAVAKSGHACPLPCLTTHEVAQWTADDRSMNLVKLAGIVLVIIFLA